MKFTRKHLTLLYLSLTAGLTSGLSYGDSWTPLVELRDNSNSFPDGKPSGGWFVTPIHATLMMNGKVLITGWGRRDQNSCGPGGTRKNGTTFVVDPNNLPNGGVLSIQPIHEAQASGTNDVLYCAGHSPLADGRILYTGGARYQDLGGPNQQEFGLNYSRVFSPASSSFTQVNSPMLGGLSGMAGLAWYPTNTRMPDGKVMVVGGFARCCDGAFSNRTLQTFDPAQHDQNQNPWSLVSPHDAAPSDMNPGLRDYIHSFLLPKPVVINGLERKMAFMGANGRIIYANTDAGTPNNQRFVTAANSQRAFGAGGWDSTAALVATGEIMTMGGAGDSGSAQRIDLYQPNTSTSRTIDTNIGRRNASSVLLPDGTVLIINGGSDDSNFAGDRRRPQVINPETGNVTTLDPWPNDGLERGYHNFAILLKDGRVLLGGGLSAIGGIGCERTDMRIYSPPYLTNGPRPVVSSLSTTSMDPGGANFSLNYSGETLKTSEQGGVVLMAPGSTTHSFDQNQRYIKLSYIRSGNSLTLTPPANNQIAPPGEYLLFVVAQTGAPSVGIPVRVEKGQQTSSSSAASSSPSNTSFHLRGTHNGWAEGDVFTRVSGSTNTFEICRNFVSGDATGGPRFKVDPNGGWGADAFPGVDSPASGWTKIVIDGNSRTILTKATNQPANCGAAVSSSSAVAASSSKSSTSSRSSSSAVSSSRSSSSTAAPGISFHLRGTHNSWAEGDLFSRVPNSATDWTICRNFLPATGGARFKVDPNGGWGDGFPGADVITSGWTRIVINGGAKVIKSHTRDLAANCGATVSSSSAEASSSSSVPASSNSSVEANSSSAQASSSSTAVSSSSRPVSSSSSAAAQMIMKPKVQTLSGQKVFILGNQAVLSNWQTSGGIPCTLESATTAVWACQGFSLPPGTVFQYKYIKRDASGNVIWEAGANRTRTAPNVTTTFNETWQ